MPTLIPLSRTNPFVRSIQRYEFVTQQTDSFKVGYDCQLFYVLEGHGFLQHTDGYLSLRPGTIAIVNPGTMYNIISNIGEKLSILNIHFDYTQLQDRKTSLIQPIPARYYDESRIICNTLPSEIPHQRGCMCISNMQHMGATLLEMQDIFEGSHHFRRALLSGQLKMLLCGLFAVLVPEKNKGANRSGGELVWDVIAYIDQHYMEPISNSDIAAHLSYHPNYLNKQMVRFTGESLHQHLISYRISRAIELLLFSKASIGDVAHSTGFKSSISFSKAFQQYLGISPSYLRTLYNDSSKYAINSFNALVQKYQSNK